MSSRNAVQRAYDDFGRAAGMEKRSGSWYGLDGEVIPAANLQKSQYGPRYYLEVGFWLPQLGDERSPKVEHWHVRARLEDLFPDAEVRIGELLDLEHELSDDRRVTELVALLNDQLVPLLERGTSVAGLNSMLEDGTLGHALVRRTASDVLAAAK